MSCTAVALVAVMFISSLEAQRPSRHSPHIEQRRACASATDTTVGKGSASEMFTRCYYLQHPRLVIAQGIDPSDRLRVISKQLLPPTLSNQMTHKKIVA